MKTYHALRKLILRLHVAVNCVNAKHCRVSISDSSPVVVWSELASRRSID